MELFKYIFESLMRPWFFYLYNSSIVIMATGSTMLGIIPSLVMIFLIQTTFFVPSNADMHSALVVESTLISYLNQFQLIAPQFRVKYY
jgi:cell shape-determining protein MreD